MCKLDSYIFSVNVKLEGKIWAIIPMMQDNVQGNDEGVHVNVVNDGGGFIDGNTKTLKAVYMVYKITNKNNNPRKVWKK